MTKRCKKCEVEKPPEDFYTCRSARDGLRRACKDCSYLSTKTGVDPIASKAAKDRYYEKNKDVVMARAVEWKKNNPEKVAEGQRSLRKTNPDLARGYALKRVFGITVEQYEELLDKQNRCCAICGRNESEFTKRMAVDHDHVSGRIRGLLCTACNYRLVARHRDGNLLRRIADYVEQGTDWYVPPKKKKKRVKRSRKATNE